MWEQNDQLFITYFLSYKKIRKFLSYILLKIPIIFTKINQPTSNLNSILLH